MSEVTFAKAFLTTLDKKPIKLQADHASDPRTYPNQSPYILPKRDHPFPKRPGTETAQVSKTITTTIKPMRAGATITLENISLDDSIHDLKTKYAQKISLPLDKVKLLYNKKPAADLKTLKDLGINGDVELTAMVMGGAAAPPSEASPIAASAGSTPATKIDSAASVDKMEVDSEASHPPSERAQIQAVEAASQEIPTGVHALRTEEFWDDLSGFLRQRLRDAPEADKVLQMFRNAWTQDAGKN